VHLHGLAALVDSVAAALTATVAAAACIAAAASHLLLQELSQMSRQEMVLALRKTCDMEVGNTYLRCIAAIWL
jgi:hypothetical protein